MMSTRQHKKRGQMSESFLTAVFLTLSGGFQDAYTYFCRDEVFANAQTGNIVLMSSHFFRGEWTYALRYFIPLLAFIAGIYLAEVIHRHLKHLKKIHWRQLILLAEIVLLFGVGFIPQSFNMGANALVSFVCAMQVQTFRKVDGNAYASTMCIGNLRSGTETLCAYFHTKDKTILRKSINYFSVIFFFGIGAGVGNLVTRYVGVRAIWFSCLLLSISFCIMFLKEEADDCL